MKIACCIANMALPIKSRRGLADRIRRFANDACAKGADLLFLPEYFAMLCLYYAPDALKDSQEVPWMAHELDNFELDVADVADAYGISILAGTWPEMTDDGIKNSAFLVTPNGEVFKQYKLRLTKGERDRMGWYLQPGRIIRPFEFMDVKCGICICHDTVSDREEKAWKTEKVKLLFVPSMTEEEGTKTQMDSHAFIFEHARRRSAQLKIPVLAVGAAGTQVFNNPLRKPQTNVGGAALFVKGETYFATQPYPDLGDSIGVMTVWTAI